MSTGELIFLVAWAVLGFLIGLACGVSVKRGGDELPGLAALFGWVAAPVVAALWLIAGAAWLLDRAVRGADRRFPGRASRERDLRAREARVAELEREVLR